ncbi:HAMP domain-containing protein [Thermodesulfobacteriota bacterium]
MNPSKLYIKIFVSFLLILIITEILIFGIFVFSMGRAFQTRVSQYNSGKIIIAKKFIEEQIRSGIKGDIAKNEALKKLLTSFGEAFEAQIWISSSSGTVLIKSFEGPTPDNIVKKAEKGMRDFHGVSVSHGFRHDRRLYATMPIDMQPDDSAMLNILFDRMVSSQPKGPFAVGLIGLGIAIAILIIPVSRFITKPIKKLKLSALKIAEGDLSHRADIKSRDEIGDLGRSFNLMADKLERMIRGGKELTANVSHELRTPLARIRIAEQIIKERLERDGLDIYDTHLDAIKEDIEELNRLIGRILEFSKLDIYEIPLNIIQVDPVEIINELLDKLQSAMDQKSLRVTKELSFEPPMFTDKEVLGMSFSNILENAVKFTPEKGEIVVKIRSKEKHLEMDVINSFKKLSGEELEKIFDPFFRIEASIENGSGLGLAITKKNLGRIGGSIEAMNSEKGFNIRIHIPQE